MEGIRRDYARLELQCSIKHQVLALCSLAGMNCINLRTFATANLCDFFLDLFCCMTSRKDHPPDEPKELTAFCGNIPLAHLRLPRRYLSGNFIY